MSKPVSSLAWAASRRAAENPPEPTSAERVLAHRERLLRCASLLLLDDGAAALEAVLRSLLQALRSPLLLQLVQRGDDGPLLRFLERLLIGHCLSRLTAQAPVRPGSAGTPRSFGRDTGGHAPVSSAPPPAVTTGPPAGPAAESMQLERTAQALGVLPPRARVTVSLVLMQGRSLAEVAELLGCNETSCRFWLNHGRKLLRRALQRDLLEGDYDPPGTYQETPPGTFHDLRRGKKATARA